MSAKDERQRLREEQDRQRAEMAFWDFYNLGPQRSLNALFRYYVAEGRAGNTRIPTRNKATLERWRKQYEWDKRAAEEDAKKIESVRRDFDELRRNRLEDLIDLSVQAIDTLREILSNPDVPWRDKRQAAETILDRVGLTAKRAEAQADEQKNNHLAPPDPNASQDVWATYYEMIKQQQ